MCSQRYVGKSLSVHATLILSEICSLRKLRSEPFYKDKISVANRKMTLHLHWFRMVRPRVTPVPGGRKQPHLKTPHRIWLPLHLLYPGAKQVKMASFFCYFLSFPLSDPVVQFQFLRALMLSLHSRKRQCQALTPPGQSDLQLPLQKYQAAYPPLQLAKERLYFLGTDFKPSCRRRKNAWGQERLKETISLFSLQVRRTPERATLKMLPGIGC